MPANPEGRGADVFQIDRCVRSLEVQPDAASFEIISIIVFSVLSFCKQTVHIDSFFF